MITSLSSNKQDFYEKLERLLNMSSGSVEGSQLLRDLKGWDSLTILEFIVMADTDYRRDVQPSEIAACQTVDDLAGLTLLSGTSRA
jgi:acyl carrier protein